MARRPNKARVEGAEARTPKHIEEAGNLTEEFQADEAPAEDPEEPAEVPPAPTNVFSEDQAVKAALPNPVPGDDGEALERITEYFKRKHPDLWQEWQNAPLQYGLEAMACRLKG